MRKDKKIVIIAGPNIYKQLADAWVLFDNTDITPKLLDKGGRNI